MNWLHSLFFDNKIYDERVALDFGTSDSSTIELVFRFLAGQFRSEQAAHTALREYDEIQASDLANKEKAFIRAYTSAEKSLINANQGELVQSYTTTELRSAVRTNVTVNKLAPYFRLIFLPYSELAVTLFTTTFNVIHTFLSENIGENSTRRVVVDALKGTVLEGSATKSGLAVDGARREAVIALTVKDITSIFSHLFTGGFDAISATLGEVHAVSLYGRMYGTIKKLYPYDIIIIFLDAMPTRSFDTERLSVQGYQVLEKMVLDRTMKLEQTKAEIEKQVQEIEEKNKKLEDTQLAMLNLLEDEKKLEEQLKVEKTSIETKVTERTRELRDHQARLLASIESLTRGFVMTDMEGNVFLTNHRVEEILGRNLKPWTLEDIQERLVGAVDVIALYQLCLKEQKTLEVKEVQYVTKVLTMMVIPIFTHEGEEKRMIGTLILLKDITEAKILQRSRDEFFSIASHELRTPLTAIRGNAAMIKDFFGDKLPSEDVGEMVNDIHESSIRLITIVNDFLDVSRLELGKIQYKSEALDVNEFVESVMKELMATVNEKHISLAYEKPDHELPKLYADRDRAKQVLINLAGNSIKFTEKGGLTIAAKQEDGFVRIRVTDTGRGIPYKSQSLLFRKFQQAGDNIHTRDSTKGTGLGLYISRLLVEGMGGKIGLDSSVEGQGSTFSFTLPVAK